MGNKNSGKRPRTAAEFDVDYWSRVNKDGPTQPHMNTPCWEWQGGRNKSGYGTIDFGGKTQLAHRATWMRWGDTSPGEKFVLHKCDNRACVRLEHLYVGTQQNNVQDMVSRGRVNVSGLVCPPERKARGECNGRHTKPERTARGESSGSAKLTVGDVVGIRAMYAAGARQVDVAQAYGIGQAHVSRLVRGENWKHV